MSVTIQTNAHQFKNDKITDYSLMLGGLNVTHDALAQYDPLVTGYGRIFMVRKPAFMDALDKDMTKRFKHILEYGNTGITGIEDAQLDSAPISGGFSGKTFDIPTVTKDDNTDFSINCYEFSGSPIREYIYTWINGIADKDSGFAHYGGLIAAGQMPYAQANHTAEFIYVVTDRTGMKVEYACMFANCFPTNIRNQQFETTQGQHEIVEYNINFKCVKYEGIDINKKAQSLIDNYRILVNSLDFNSGLDTSEVYKNRFNDKTGYDASTGKLINRDKVKYRVSNGKIYDYDKDHTTMPSYTNHGANL